MLTGARQTGKTSLLQHLFPQAEYISFDWPATADEAESNPAEFLARFKGPVILDEIQYVPSLFRHLKIQIDQNRNQNYGALFENFVYNELSRQAELNNFKNSLFFLRDKNNLEVDFLIEKGNSIKLIEVKTAEYPKEALNNLQKVKSMLDDKYKVTLFVACQTPSETPQIIQGCTFYNPLTHKMDW